MGQVINCTCKHGHQDKLYGTGRRYANVCRKDNKLIGYRCTVCSVLFKASDVPDNKPSKREDK